MLDAAFVQSTGARSLESHLLDPTAFFRTRRRGRLRSGEHQQLPWVSFAPLRLARGAVSTFRPVISFSCEGRHCSYCLVRMF